MSRPFAEYKRVTRDHITGLQETLAKERADRTMLEYRAELAERQVRQVAAEKEIWKHQAKEAQTSLKSLGRGE